MARTRTNTNTYRWSDVPIFFDIPFAVMLLKMSRPTVLRLCQSGKLPAQKIGNQWRISRDKLRKYFDGENAKEEN